MNIDTVVSGLGIAASILAAGLWLSSSLVTVPDNIDTFIDALRLQSQLSAYAAGSATVAAICAAIVFFRHSFMSV